MRYFGEEKPSLDDIEHYGVLGMKWGVHKQRTTAQDIREAQNRLMVRSDKVYRQRKRRNAEKRGTPERAAQQRKLDKATRDFQNDPDRVTAARFTRGEKALLILGTPATFGLSLAAIPVMNAVSLRIAYKQAHGLYNKPKK